LHTWIKVMSYNLMLILAIINSNVERVPLELPAFEERINLLLIIGVLILGLILLISLKIYQLESQGKGERRDK